MTVYSANKDVAIVQFAGTHGTGALQRRVWPYNQYETVSVSQTSMNMTIFIILLFLFKHCLSLRSESENKCTYLTSVLSSPVFRAPVYLSIYHLSLLKIPLAPLYYLDPLLHT